MTVVKFYDQISFVVCDNFGFLVVLLSVPLAQFTVPWVTFEGIGVLVYSEVWVKESILTGHCLHAVGVENLFERRRIKACVVVRNFVEAPIRSNVLKIVLALDARLLVQFFNETATLPCHVVLH